MPKQTPGIYFIQNLIFIQPNIEFYFFKHFFKLYKKSFDNLPYRSVFKTHFLGGGGLKSKRGLVSLILIYLKEMRHQEDHYVDHKVGMAGKEAF